jgi:hypothetical protein
MYNTLPYAKSSVKVFFEGYHGITMDANVAKVEDAADSRR